ncbi:pilus assembly protein TadG-related protein [Falsiroseomonas bella]|uniref:pilus assembly protein TadG-related protein n=1 Tax=Falsiroseomonas bella TaxID=2184016 RepID=UPI001304CF9A|nr:pilus assembly protein TadG-related protein [Falsiroseomonas bella]
MRKDRRGLTTISFAAGAVMVFGALAVATDSGVWYAARRGAQSAADSAAAAGAVTLAMRGAGQVQTVARDVAARNGFAADASTTIEVNVPPTSGPNRATPGAVEVIVRQTQSLGASGFFLSTPPTVRGRSVGILRSNADVCVLALTGQLAFSGGANVSTPGCMLASNRPADVGVTVSGGGSVEAYGITTVGSCQNCSGSGISLTQPAAEWQVPASNPFAALDDKILPAFGNGTCIDPGNNPTSLLPYERNGRRAYCKDIKLNANATLTLEPGTYYLHNASLVIQSGRVNCPTCTGGAGVTFVLTGDASKVGGIDISANAVVRLQAPTTAADPDYSGVLFYRDPRATNGLGGGNPAVRVNGGAQLSLAGGMYFPNADVRFNGNSSATGCSILVAAAIEFGGSATASQCSRTGTAVPQARVVAFAN